MVGSAGQDGGESGEVAIRRRGNFDVISRLKHAVEPHFYPTANNKGRTSTIWFLKLPGTVSVNHHHRHTPTPACLDDALIYICIDHICIMGPV